jgi:hypothetical protein
VWTREIKNVAIIGRILLYPEKRIRRRILSDWFLEEDRMKKTPQFLVFACLAVALISAAWTKRKNWKKVPITLNF